MSITLASDALSDAEVTDEVGRENLTAAARLWVRHWPGALAVARLYVEAAEVPGLAAEALVGTVAITATGRGPRSDVPAFVSAAVRELGEDDGDQPFAPDPAMPDIFVSRYLTFSYADLSEAEQRALSGTPLDQDDAIVLGALTALQTSYLAAHLGDAPTNECGPVHLAMLAVAEEPSETFAAPHWLHVSTCAWCTEAFHEVAFSNVALSELIAPDTFVVAPVAVAPVAIAPVEAEPAEELLVDDAVVEEDPIADPITEVTLAVVTPLLLADKAKQDEPAEATASGTHRAGAWTVLKTGRSRVVGGVIAAAALATVALVLGQSNDGSTPTASPRKADVASSHGPTTPSDPTSAATSTGTPTAGAAVDTSTPANPISVPTGVNTRPAATSIPSDHPTPTARTTKPPKPTKGPSAGPSRSPTTPASSPTPTPTPTKSCNPLQHLLGMC
jgi:hypothetical protein